MTNQTNSADLRDLCRWVLLEAKYVPLPIRVRAFNLAAPLPPTFSMGGYELSSEQHDVILEAVKADRKIMAIKGFRTATGAALKDAKEIIEANFPSMVSRI